MKDHDPVVGSLHSEAPRSSEDAGSSERLDPSRTLSVAPGGIARQRMRVAGRTLGSLLLGGAAVLGSVLVFRQGLLPLIDAVFQPGPELLSAFRRAGIGHGGTGSPCVVSSRRSFRRVTTTSPT